MTPGHTEVGSNGAPSGNEPDRRVSVNALPFSGLGAAKPALRFYAYASAATRSVCNGLFGSIAV